MKFIFICTLISILGFKCLAQTEIPFPIQKDSTWYDKRDEWNYAYWIKKIVNIDKQISQVNAPGYDGEDKEVLLYNRFISYYNVYTNSPSDIIHIFFDAFLVDKDSFCRLYKNIDKRLLSQRQKSYYAKENRLMDSVCACVYHSYNSELINRLKVMAYRDQKYRPTNNIDLRTKQRELDKENQQEFKEIMDIYGYPNRRKVGVEYEMHLFYVLQHSNLSMMKEYLDEIKRQVDAGQLNPKAYPLLYDRIKFIEDKPQLYGTQSIIDQEGNSKIYKLEDPDNVNKRRLKFKLSKIHL